MINREAESVKFLGQSPDRCGIAVTHEACNAAAKGSLRFCQYVDQFAGQIPGLEQPDELNTSW